MSFFTRLRRLVLADAHGVVDTLEDTPLLLKQCVRDAEAALAANRARLGGLDAEARQLDTRIERLDRRIEAADADVELALGQQQDELARFAVRRLLPLRRERADVRERRTVLEVDRAELAETVAEQAEALADLQARVAERIAAGGAPAPPAPTTDEEIELELLRRRATEGA